MFEISYADGSWEIGYMGNDTVRVGQLSIPNAQVTEFDKNTMDYATYDGIFGRGFQSPPVVNRTGSTPPNILIVQQGLLPAPVYTFYLETTGTHTMAQVIAAPTVGV